MKTLMTYAGLIFCILFLSFPVFGDESKKGCFELDVDAGKISTTSRPIPITLKVIYNGTNSIEVIDLESNFLDISFDEPQGWALREKPPVHDIDGRLPVVVLREGASMSRTLDLQDFFSKVAAGETLLKVSLRIWPDAGRSTQLIVLSAVVPLNLVDESDQSVQEYIDAFRLQILGEQNSDKRAALYRKISGVPSPKIIPLLTLGLKDLEVQELHGEMRKKAIEMTEQYKCREILVKYLAEDGARYDEYFFRMWQARGLPLSETERNVLCNARNPWIRLYALGASPTSEDITAELDNLNAEISDMTSYLERLRGK